MQHPGALRLPGLRMLRWVGGCSPGKAKPHPGASAPPGGQGRGHATPGYASLTRATNVAFVAGVARVRRSRTRRLLPRREARVEAMQHPGALRLPGLRTTAAHGHTRTLERISRWVRAEHPLPSRGYAGTFARAPGTPREGVRCSMRGHPALRARASDAPCEGTRHSARGHPILRAKASDAPCEGIWHSVRRHPALRARARDAPCERTRHSVRGHLVLRSKAPRTPVTPLRSARFRALPADRTGTRSPAARAGSAAASRRRPAPGGAGR